MEDLLKPVKTVRSNIGGFDDLSLTEDPEQSSESVTISEATEQPSTKSGGNKIVDLDDEVDLNRTIKAGTKIVDLDDEVDLNRTIKARDYGGSQIASAKDGQGQKPPSGVELQSSVSLPALETVDNILTCLNSRPDSAALYASLKYLDDGINGKNDFNVRASSAKAAQILNVLVTKIIPDYWTSINSQNEKDDASKVRKVLLSCLRSVAGLGALLASLKTSKAAAKRNKDAWLAKDAIECISQLLEPKQFLYEILVDVIMFHDRETQQHMVWQEFISTIAGGRLLSVAAEAVFTTRCLNPVENQDAWIADGHLYACWMGRNISHAILTCSPGKERLWLMIAQVVKRSITMAHSDMFIAEVINDLVLDEKAMWTSIRLLMVQLSNPDQKALFKLILNYVCGRFFPKVPFPSDDRQAKRMDRTISGIAAIIVGIVRVNTHLEECLVTWVSSDDTDTMLYGIEGRRAMIAALGDKQERIVEVMDKTFVSFADNIRIKHTTMMQQEALAQVILLTAGYLYRLDPSKVSGLSRSSVYLQAVSNRLASSLPRARLLGMIVGTAISRLVEAPGKSMNFDVVEMETSDVQEFLNLVNVRDDIGSLSLLSSESTLAPRMTSKKREVETPGSRHVPLLKAEKKVTAIEELSEDSDGDDGLVPYQKPDDDPEDSDEDPTLINRSKPIAPVYIKDLVSGLQAIDKPETVDLAIKTAPGLIRRKANFGTELSENIDRLASALINVQDGMGKRENQKLRLQSMIACVVAQPSRIGPWFISMYFEADLAQAQRANMLTAVGLGARELGGFSDATELPNDAVDFPSQKLQPRLAAQYAPESAPLDALAKQIGQTTLRPMALAAADQMSGPDVLKVRTFSSRMEVEKKGKAKARERKAKIPRDLHKLLTESFYLPLCGRLQVVCERSTSSASTALIEPTLLRLSIQTLSIILNTMGPNALGLPIVTRETLLLLTTLHNTPLAMDPYVLPALLQLLLATLDMNVSAGSTAEERLITEFGNMIAELVAWAGSLGERVSIPDDGDGSEKMMSWTVIAAGVQVRWSEVGRKFQGRMLGLGLDDF